jgi:HEAT repeats
MSDETDASSRAATVERLIRDLTSRDPAVRLEAVHALGELGDERATDSLIRALEEPELTEPAAKALDDIKATRAVRHLLRLLKHENTRVQASAARALGEIEDSQALVPLLEVVSDAQMDIYVRRVALQSLEKLGYKPRRDRRPPPVIVAYVSGAALIAAAVGLSSALGPFAGLAFAIGLGLLVVYWIRESRRSGGTWYSDPDGGGDVWIPADVSDLGSGFGGDGGGNGGAGNGGGAS